MRDYEIVYIFRSSLSTEDVEAKLERYHGIITDGQGEISAVVQWGKRQLAYPIQKQPNGHYVVAQFTSPPDPLTELERVLKLEDDVLRYLVVLSEGELPLPEALPQAPERTPAPEPAETPKTDGGDTAEDEAASDEKSSDAGEDEAAEADAAENDAAEGAAAEDEAAEGAEAEDAAAEDEASAEEPGSEDQPGDDVDAEEADAADADEAEEGDGDDADEKEE